MSRVSATPQGKKLLKDAKSQLQTTLTTSRKPTYTDISKRIEELGEKFSINPKTIQRFFNGDRVEYENASLICRVLGLRLEQVVPRDQLQGYSENWTRLCQEQNEKLRQPATREGFELKIFIPLGLIEQTEVSRRDTKENLSMDQVYPSGENSSAQVIDKFTYEKFLNHIGLGDGQADSTENITIVGKPGAGKTNLLHNLATLINDNNKGLAIFISLSNLYFEEFQDLDKYLESKWLKDALGIPETQITKYQVDKFWERLNQPDVWLLLDGLDEIPQSNNIEDLLIRVKTSLDGSLSKARVVISCRTNVWDEYSQNKFSNFKTFRTLDFSDDQRNDFIDRWFRAKNNSESGNNLINQLQQSGQARLQKMVQNPLMLSLLCQLWSDGEQGPLPQTRAQLYNSYLNGFYKWKRRVLNLTQEPETRRQLNLALCRLALAGLNNNSRYRFSETFAIETMGGDNFQKASTLGWLNIVDCYKNENIYAFFHPTFQEFFAALFIKDWDYFLPYIHENKPINNETQADEKINIYRVFGVNWREVILLWLGLKDIPVENKNTFINKLLSFNDGCGGFYSIHALLLADDGIKEY